MVGPISKLQLRKILMNKERARLSKKWRRGEEEFLKNESKLSQLQNNNILDVDLSRDISSFLQVHNELLDTRKDIKQVKAIQDVKNEIIEKPQVEEKQQLERKVYTKSKIDAGIMTKENTIILSRIVDLATTRPIENIKDIETEVDIDYYYEPSKYITNEELYTLCKEHPDMKYLDLSNCDKIMDFSPISNLTQLEQLSVNNCDYIIDLDFLEGLPNLKVLNAGNTDLRYIEALESISTLEIVNLTSNPIMDITPLKNCLNLHELVLWGCLPVSDISVIENFPELRVLDIESCSITDLSSAKDLLKLNTILMDNCSGVRDYSFLKNLTELRYFSADGNRMIGADNLEYFRNLVNMEYLSLKQRGITSLDYFKNMTKLKEIKFVDNMIKDLSPLENCVDMLKVDFTKNKELSDLSPLHNMHKLEKLIVCGSVGQSKITKTGTTPTSFDRMQITDLSVMQNFPKLKEVDLDGNTKLKDISWFKYCLNLEEVQLNNCTQLENADPLGLLEKLFRLEIKNCPKVRDLYCLSNCEALQQLNYDGTSVPTVKMVSVLKRCTKIYVLKGNYSNDIQAKFLKAGGKRIKLCKSRKSYKS